MVEGASAIDAVFHALASDAPRDILGRLATGELTAGQLAAPLAMSLAAASRRPPAPPSSTR
jgi:DNA-binding transcriptional ArsR family regulator